MLCKNCGEENKKNSIKCKKCGAILKENILDENLTIPQDIEIEQAKNDKRNFLYRTFTIVMGILFAIAAIFTILTFVVPENYGLILGIVSVTFFIAFIVVWIVKKKKIKNLYKTKKNKKK